MVEEHDPRNDIGCLWFVVFHGQQQLPQGGYEGRAQAVPDVQLRQHQSWESDRGNHPDAETVLLGCATERIAGW